MAGKRTAADPAEVIAYGEFLRDIAEPEGKDAAGLSGVIELLRPLSVPVPDSAYLPSGEAFARELNGNLERLLRALGETGTDCRLLGEAVAQAGRSFRDAEEARSAKVASLGSGIPVLRAAGASPLGGSTDQTAAETPPEADGPAQK
ncbi:hypothetical protein [Streptomyces sp. NPDC057426]|uniref:hypothetical protein n=1 Tax=Streptomyces sp. NPDC057426 TaxID=3346128 RepID=UPI0036AE2E02